MGKLDTRVYLKEGFTVDNAQELLQLMAYPSGQVVGGVDKQGNRVIGLKDNTLQFTLNSEGKITSMEYDSFLMTPAYFAQESTVRLTNGGTQRSEALEHLKEAVKGTPLAVDSLKSNAGLHAPKEVDHTDRREEERRRVEDQTFGAIDPQKLLDKVKAWEAMPWQQTHQTKA